MADKEQEAQRGELPVVCPFNIEARFCEHQESFATSISDAMRGEIDFYCKLPKGQICPRIMGGKV